MTSHTSRNGGWRRAATGVVAAVALAAGLLTGLDAPTALAKPGDPTADADTPPPVPVDQVLGTIASEYDLGAGGGQVSGLIHSVMKLNSQGFKPSNANRDALVAALDEKPNQTPLIEALQATLVYQRRAQARQQAAVTSPNQSTIGINQYNPNDPTGGQSGLTISPPSN
jgi:hypothetical protein